MVKSIITNGSNKEEGINHIMFNSLQIYFVGKMVCIKKAWIVHIFFNYN